MMAEYIERLQELGFTMLTSARIYEFFMLYFNKDLLDYFIEKLERENVEEIQSKSNRA